MAEKERSLQRSKKTMITLAEIIGPRVLDSLAPGAGVAFDVTKIGYDHIKRYLQDRGKTRIEDLHTILLKGCKNEEELKKILETEFTPENYYGILSAVMQDEEDSKVKIYAKILSALLCGRLDERYKTHVIKSAKELTFSAFELMREIYISTQVLFEGEEDKESQLQKLLQRKDPLHSHTVQSLMRYGYISDKPDSNPLVKEASGLLVMVVKAVWAPDELTPEAIGRRPWGSKMQVVVIAPDITDAQILKIQSTLGKLDIILTVTIPKKVSEFIKNQALSRAATGKASPLLFLICDDGQLSHKDEIDELLLDTRVINRQPTIITFPGASTARIYETKGFKVFDMSSAFDEKLEELQDMLKTLAQ